MTACSDWNKLVFRGRKRLFGEKNIADWFFGVGLNQDLCLTKNDSLCHSSSFYLLRSAGSPFY
jgi:hypothetical protein